MSGARTAAHLEISYGAEPPYEVSEVKEFSYASSVLAVGEECAFTVVNDKGKYTDKLRGGSTVRLYLSHPDVNGGARALKHLGLIVHRRASAAEGTIRITSADLGWHLLGSHAPLWTNLRKITYQQLCDPRERKSLIDPSWGLQGLRAGKDANGLNRRLKLGRQGIQQAYDLAAQVTHAIQVEPGESVYDLMTRHAQRLNLLVNVSVDGYVQLWNPDYGQRPLYRIVAKESGTNVLEGLREDSIDSVWTHVECVGESIGFAELNDPLDPNASHRRGAFYNLGALPFTHRLTFADGEMYRRDLAKRQAEWRFKRGLYDALFLRYQVSDHHQGGTWWECDTLAEVEDELLGVSGTFYVDSVTYESSAERGDTVDVILRKPGLLSASWGEWSPSSRVKGGVGSK